MEPVISEIHQPWGSSFFIKCSKFKLDFKNAEKDSEKNFCFRDTCIWIGCVKLPLLKREYFWLPLSVLGKCLEILHITNRDLASQLPSKWSINMVKVLSFKFQQISARFPCCFPKDPLKRDFLDIDVTMFFGVRNFGNTSAMRVILFLKMFKI